MSKEYVLQFNLNNYISVEEPYKKDLGTVIIGKVNDDSGILNVLFDSHKEDIVNFFIELINYVSDLEAKLAESEEEIKVIDEDRQFKAEMWTKFANKCKELEKQLAEKDKEHMEAMQNALNDFLKLRQELNQDKISFCIDKLEKVKEFNIQQVFSSKPLDNFIYNQIKQLKGDE